MIQSDVSSLTPTSVATRLVEKDYKRLLSRYSVVQGSVRALEFERVVRIVHPILQQLDEDLCLRLQGEGITDQKVLSSIIGYYAADESFSEMALGSDNQEITKKQFPTTEDLQTEINRQKTKLAGLISESDWIEVKEFDDLGCTVLIDKCTVHMNNLQQFRSRVFDAIEEKYAKLVARVASRCFKLLEKGALQGAVKDFCEDIWKNQCECDALRHRAQLACRDLKAQVLEMFDNKIFEKNKEYTDLANQNASASERLEQAQSLEKLHVDRLHAQQTSFYTLCEWSSDERVWEFIGKVEKEVRVWEAANKEFQKKHSDQVTDQDVNERAKTDSQKKREDRLGESFNSTTVTPVEDEFEDNVDDIQPTSLEQLYRSFDFNCNRFFSGEGDDGLRAQLDQTWSKIVKLEKSDSSTKLYSAQLRLKQLREKSQFWLGALGIEVDDQPYNTIYLEWIKEQHQFALFFYRSKRYEVEEARSWIESYEKGFPHKDKEIILEESDREYVAAKIKTINKAIPHIKKAISRAQKDMLYRYEALEKLRWIEEYNQFLSRYLLVQGTVRALEFEKIVRGAYPALLDLRTNLHMLLQEKNLHSYGGESVDEEIVNDKTREVINLASELYEVNTSLGKISLESDDPSITRKQFPAVENLQNEISQQKIQLAELISKRDWLEVKEFDDLESTECFKNLQRLHSSVLNLIEKRYTKIVAKIASQCFKLLERDDLPGHLRVFCEELWKTQVLTHD